MATTKLDTYNRLLLLIYMGLFSFGQIPAVLLTFFVGRDISFQPSDALIFLLVVINIFYKPHLFMNVVKSEIGKFIYILIFSLCIGALMFGFGSSLSLLYFLRAVIYLLFAYIVWHEGLLEKKEMIYFFIVSGLVISVIGIFQYMLIPDTRFLKVFGWDDHYYRLISTFLDPAFTAILLVFSLLFALFGWKTKKQIQRIIVISIFTVALLLTYSRASYLALFVGVIVYAVFQQKMYMKYIIFGLLFSFSLFLLPRPGGGEGVKLERTFSFLLKVQNSRDAIAVASTSPIFGIGYNNMCEARTQLLLHTTETALISHSCSGADNSILFIFSTLGIVGLLSVFFGTRSFLRKVNNPLFYAIVSALFVHMQFTNTLFYPWVFIWIVFAGRFLCTTQKT